MTEMAELTSPGKELDVTAPSGTIFPITYNIGNLPPGLSRPIEDNLQILGEYIVDFVCHVVTGWDLVVDKAPVPTGWTNRLAMREQVAGEVFGAIYRDIRKDLAPDPTKSTSSRAGSTTSTTTAAATSRSTRGKRMKTATIGVRTGMRPSRMHATPVPTS